MQRLSKNKLAVISSMLLLAILLFSYASTAVSNAQFPTDTPSVESTKAPTFGITSSVSSLTIIQGTTQTVSLYLYSIDRYNGTATLSTSSPSDITSHLATSALTVKYNQNAQTTITLSVSSRAYDGKYTVTIIGHDGSVSHSANVTVQVVHPDVSMKSPSNPTSIAYGTYEFYTVQVSSINGYSGGIHLKAEATDFSCKFLSSSATLFPGENKNVTLMLQLTRPVSDGSHSITITGTNDKGISHTISFSVMVIRPDFSMSVYPSSSNVAAGKNTYLTIQLQPINRFNGSIAFSTSHPIGWSAPTFSPSPVSVAYNHNSNALVTISVPPGTPSGSYTISITASTVRYPGTALSYTERVTINVLNG